MEELYDDVFFVAASPAMRKIRSQAALVAQRGYSRADAGGKRYRQGSGGAADSQTVTARSSHFPEGELRGGPGRLLESELFGYEAGAFTGATHAKPGKFELCNKGTILLDEIGEMPPCLQAKLLHVLQDQQFSRLGSRSVIKVDVRILAATNINIPEALASKRCAKICITG